MVLTATIIWIIVIILFLAVEISTTALVSLWFAIGALASAIASFFTDSVIFQVALFLVISAFSFLFLYPTIKKARHTNQETNTDMLIGERGVVIVPIDDILSTGQVQVSGQVWAAKTEAENEVLNQNTVIEVIRIEGVKLVVRPLEEESSINAETQENTGGEEP